MSDEPESPRSTRRSTKITPLLLEGDQGGADVPLRVLLVDDEPLILRVFSRTLRKAGFTTVTVATGDEALAALDNGEFDVLFTDINMPGLSGVELMAGVRRRDPDLPIVLVTGNPTVDTAMRAVELGALRYMCKPVSDTELITVARSAGKLSRLARLKRVALGAEGLNPQLGDLRALAVRFELALEQLWVALQPIVSWSQKKVIAYEALCRSDEPLLRSPLDLLAAAERLGRIHDLGRVIRSRAVLRLADMPADCLLFINAHPHDLTDPDLTAPDGSTGPVASRIVIEVTERRALDGMDVPEVVARLRRTGFQLAVDDLGAGYAGLTSFAQIEPSVVKLDMSLIRGVDQQPMKQRIIRGMVQLCRDMGALVVVEGVETVGERDALLACGCDLMQGYLFARPSRELWRWPEAEPQ